MDYRRVSLSKSAPLKVVAEYFCFVGGPCSGCGQRGAESAWQVKSPHTAKCWTLNERK